MVVLINFKICDNAKECNGPPVCPTGAIYYDDEKKTLRIDNKKCTSCGACEKACSVGAIHVAKTEKEFQKIKKEIEEDPRTISDLFVDRYGGSPIEPAFSIEHGFETEILEAQQIAVVELFKPETIHCLIASVPIKFLFEKIRVKFRKALASDELVKRYDVKKLPALLFFKKGELVGKIEGYYSKDQKDELKKKVGEILNRVDA